jgi:hypothetical protein
VGYYMRALLAEWEPRPLSDLIAFSREYGHELRVEGAAVDDAAWRDADVYGPESESPVELEVALDEGEDSLLRGEVEEFREALEYAEGEPAAIGRVAEHLERTRAIVAVRVLASDSERGMEAAWAILAYYAQRDGVLFQADAEGFYDGEDLIVRT